MLEIVPKREAMSKYNLHAAELNRVVGTALAGQEVGKLIEGNRRFDIVVRLNEELREKIDDLKRLPVRVDDGGLLTLGQVADFKVVEQVAAISREHKPAPRRHHDQPARTRRGKFRPRSAEGKSPNKSSYLTATPLNSADSSRTSRKLANA